ncbi:MAG TPA: type II toxin-antitoxin system RelE/ParE family toxin [Ignavibacteria bacterium]|nr:type II toxin-antitoxin system RelE/ParE family toxin [Ignavibacteria bacterium]
MREVNFYKSESGKSPVADYLDLLDGKHAQKIAWVLELIEELPKVPKQYFKKLTNTEDIWEIRIVFSNNTFRLLGFFETNRNFLVTNGFTKKSQKTPLSEIKLAEERKRNFYKRKK